MHFHNKVLVESTIFITFKIQKNYNSIIYFSLLLENAIEMINYYNLVCTLPIKVSTINMMIGAVMIFNFRIF